MASTEQVVDNLPDDDSHQQSVEASGVQVTTGTIVTFRYGPQPRAMMETYGKDHGVHLPHTGMMQHAYVTACRIREKELPYPIQQAYYAGIDFDNIQTSEELTEAANQGLVAVQNCYFDDFLTAEYYRGACRPDKYNPDPTVPLTTPAQKAHVQLLVRAFNNTNSCDDNPQMIRPFLEKRHDPKLVEVLCWGILKTCIMRANSDEPLLTAYEPSKARNSAGVNSFADRFNAIVKSMSRSKTICKHLHDPPYVNVFVDDPVRAVRRVDANRDLNRLKGQVMGKGKKVLEAEVKASGVTAEAKGLKRRAILIEGQDASTDERSPKRRSLVVKVPVRAPPAPAASPRGEERINDGEPISPLLKPQYTAPDALTASATNFKEEQETARRMQTNYSHPPSRPTYNPGYGMSQSTAFANFDPFQPTSSHGSSASSSFGFHDPSLYGTNAYSTGFGGMQDYFTTNPLRQHQAQYVAQRPSFVFAPMASRVAASAPTTPSVPGFVSGEVSSNTGNSPNTTSSRSFVIPDETTSVGEVDNVTGEVEDVGAEFGVLGTF